ncbi:uncharacterized protein BDZ99DRAFT_381376 [Mytilinidion resinicola]|uniref:RNA helicase n=1 Tax=Mytilinidion resinicola TaxID=574789 RepID=A0A6A6YWM0_9PEZI|nr:uncharacterized protein BDZ99DRAFT_381376 [Mytilinidion resinicola]KAF2812919.1 hypothetical protein BDZ99DRAFT_381376 [Mytilinidion resinicola]
MRPQGQRPGLCLFCTLISTPTQSRALPQIWTDKTSPLSDIRHASISLGARRYRSSTAEKRRPTRTPERSGRSERPVLVAPGKSFIKLAIPPTGVSQVLGHRLSGLQQSTKSFQGIARRTPYGFTPSWRFGADNPLHFKKRVENALSTIQEELSEPLLLDSLELDKTTFSKIWSVFQKHILSLDKATSKERKEEWDALQNIQGGNRALLDRLKYAFYGHMVGSKFTKAELSNQKQLADLRFPPEWFPTTRQMRRTIHLHVGPTNSGKTYHALQRLEQATSGVYAGPLRLLAHEIYTRLNAKGKTCGLVTGEERRIPETTGERVKMWSCTVEMAPLNIQMDVAVIDEIQMINSPERGWAWTQAYLGVQAKEVHLCGEERTVPLIKELAASIGDRLVIHEYKRLSPLEMMHRSLNGDLKKLEKGDCVVSFSVMGIHALRKQIEKQTGRKVAIIYGSLPPETRAQQAKLFNDPDNDYDYLVASDAVGMGLNLSIKRVIFEAASKHNGVSHVPLKIAEVKQIGGRAGRYRTAHQATVEDTASLQKPDGSATNVDSNDASALSVIEGRKETPQSQQTVGYVTTLEAFDHRAVEYAMNAEAEPITTAGIFPPALIIERFASYFPPGTPFSYVLLRLNEISRIHPRYQLCALKDALRIADAIQPVKTLTIADRIILIAAPCGMRDPLQREMILEFAKRIGEQRTAPLLDITQFNFDLLDQEPTGKREYLAALESFHKGLVLYLWLSFRFTGVFTQRALAEKTKSLVEKAIEHTLSEFSFTEERRNAITSKRQEQLLRQLKIQYQGTGRGEGKEAQEEDVQEEQHSEEDALKEGTESQEEPDLQEDAVQQNSLQEGTLQESAVQENAVQENAENQPEPEQDVDNEPPDVRDIITDETSFREDTSSTRDDYGEYPSPELESIKQHPHPHAS